VNGRSSKHPAFNAGAFPADPTDGQSVKFTSHLRDAETGLDFMGARYYSNVQGRFTSPDVPFADQQVEDPQSWNLYTYVRNNPLKYVDPSGQAVELLGSEEEREKELAAIRAALGAQAGAYVYENAIQSRDRKGNTTTRYYVGVYSGGPDGKGPSFEQLNDVAGELAPIIADRQVVGLGIVASGSSATTDLGERIPIGPAPYATPGVTSIFGGQLGIRILDPASNQGTLPIQATMSNGFPGSLNPGIVVGHELGHARAIMTGDYQTVDRNPFNSAEAALRIERKVRLLQGGPRAPVRIVH
jgi:RHS repeat-associated protein